MQLSVVSAIVMMPAVLGQCGPNNKMPYPPGASKCPDAPPPQGGPPRGGHPSGTARGRTEQEGATQGGHPSGTSPGGAAQGGHPSGAVQDGTPSSSSGQAPDSSAFDASFFIRSLEATLYRSEHASAVAGWAYAVPRIVD